MASPTHETKIESGKYKGTALKDVPAQYLLWCYAKYRLPVHLRTYVRQNYLELLNRAYNEEKEKE